MRRANFSKNNGREKHECNISFRLLHFKLHVRILEHERANDEGVDEDQNQDDGKRN